MVIQTLLFVGSFGLYGIYWYHVTLSELHLANGEPEGGGCIWTLLLLVPIFNLLVFWHYAHEYAKFVDFKYPGIAIFILWLMPPIVWFLVQWDLNRASTWTD